MIEERKPLDTQTREVVILSEDKKYFWGMKRSEIGIREYPIEYPSKFTKYVNQNSFTLHFYCVYKSEEDDDFWKMRHCKVIGYVVLLKDELGALDNEWYSFILDYVREDKLGDTVLVLKHLVEDSNDRYGKAVDQIVAYDKVSSKL